MLLRATKRSRTPARPRSRRSRTLTRIGCALIVAGSAVLSYIGWELHATTWLAQREQERAVAATESLWSADERRSSEEERDASSDVVALIRIPVLGEKYVVPAYQGTVPDTLERGFGIFDSSSGPGAEGNFVLGGHRVTNGEPLREMRSLEAGDEIVVETRDATYRYVLDTDGDSLTVGTDATWVTGTVPVDPQTRQPVSDVVGSTRLLTLVTCAEIFHTDDRLVAFGHLVAREP